MHIAHFVFKMRGVSHTVVERAPYPSVSPGGPAARPDSRPMGVADDGSPFPALTALTLCVCMACATPSPPLLQVTD